MANSSLCEKCRLVKPRRGKRPQPRVSTLGYRSHQGTRPERAQERINYRRRFHRNNVMLVPIPNLPPFEGDSVFFGVLSGLKPWAESCCPFGTVLPASAPPEDKKSIFAQCRVSCFCQIGITTGPDRFGCGLRRELSRALRRAVINTGWALDCSHGTLSSDLRTFPVNLAHLQ